MNKEQRMSREHIRQFLKEIYECHDSGHKIIQEETLNEDGRDEDAERAIGLYFNTNPHRGATIDTVLIALNELYRNALNTATVELGNDDEAIDTVNRGIQRVLRLWLQERT